MKSIIMFMIGLILAPTAFLAAYRLYDWTIKYVETNFILAVVGLIGMVLLSFLCLFGVGLMGMSISGEFEEKE